MADNLKYSFEEAQEWSHKTRESSTDGKNILYIFGAISFILLFASIILFMRSDNKPSSSKVAVDPPAVVAAIEPATAAESDKKAQSSAESSYEDSDCKSESATSITEHDVLEDIKKSKRSINAKSS